MNLRQAFVFANEFKEGDLQVGGTVDVQVRTDARRSLEALPLEQIVADAFVDDGVTEALERSLNARVLKDIAGLTVANVKHFLLGPRGAEWVHQHRSGLRSEAIAAVVKVMTDDELSIVARTLFHPHAGDGITVGSPRHFGSRIQPNSPGDDEDEILLSALDGLTYGCGDVIIGLNPASDDVDTIVQLEDLLRRIVVRLQLPTRYCVLSDIVKQTRARERAAVDVGFQSLAGTSKALFGMVGLDAGGILDLAHGFDGCYFETGQGSAVTNGAAEGVDMVTLEARAYGVARYIQTATGAWTIVNDVAGFIGPEVFSTADQLQRACLEDVVMAKLHGLTMGLDVCATFHMGIPPDVLAETTRRIVDLAAPAYLMAVAGNADPMLGYLTTSFREHPQLRRGSGRSITSAMQNRLVELGVFGLDGAPVHPSGDGTGAASLYALYTKAGGDRRTTDALREEGRMKIARMQARGYDVGTAQDADDAAWHKRIDAIYAQARRALYAAVDADVLRSVSPHHLHVRTIARDRDDYLAHPESGETIVEADAHRLVSAVASRGSRRPQVQVVISDGLNANALNENLRAVLPPLRRRLLDADVHVAELDVAIENGRVRAGYQVGALVDADVVVHFIGERPGTGLDAMSAYLTYGRHLDGRPRWSRGLDHSATTAVCGIHRLGKPPAAAVDEIARTVQRIVATRQSGVALSAAPRLR